MKTPVASSSTDDPKQCDEYTLQHPPPDYNDCAPPEDEVVVLSLHKGHTVRFTGIDEPVAQALYASAVRAWPAGVKERRWSGGVGDFPKYYKLKFHGSPWTANQGDKSAISARRLMSAVLRTLLEHGWRVEGMGDCITYRWGSVASLILMKSDPRVLKAGDMFVFAFNDMDKVWLIDAPGPVEGVVSMTFATCWTQGLKGISDCFGAKEFKLQGWPWIGAAVHLDNAKSTIEDVASRAMMAKILFRLKSMGFLLYATIDVSSDKEPPSWILIRSG